MENKEKFYITTAIAYSSRKPHIGNTYEVIMTDALARFKRQIGCDVFFLTGTDEHGQKIEDIAKEAGVDPKTYVDGVAGEIRQIWDLMNTSYDKFIRTTDEEHVKTVQHMFEKFYKQGDIYKSEYEGWYCVPDESFFTETQVVDGKCPECGRPVVRTKEEAYFFRMSKYADQLMQYIEDHPEFIEPESRKKEMVNNFLKAGLQDLCVSRTSFKWGIPVTFDDKHVVYVWLDALANYITALGYDIDEQGELYQKYWPADVHIIGKDILRFHTIYWPIFLMALGLPLPKKVFGHPWFNFGSDKMSKSRGNVIYADELAARFGVDAVRYYCLSEMPYASDGSITYENIITRYNSDLANNLGNLVKRSLAMTEKYFGGVIPAPAGEEGPDAELKAAVKTAVAKSYELMNTYHVADAAEEIFSMLRRANKYIDETTPWVLANEGKTERLGTVLYNLLETIRVAAVLLNPFITKTSESIIEQLATDVTSYESVQSFGGLASGGKIGEIKTLFERIDEKKVLEEIEKENEAKRAAAAAKEKPADANVNEIGIEDFMNVELRAAKIIACEPVPKAKKLLKLRVDLGYEQRQVVSGIAKDYKPEDLIGKTVVLVANLKKATLCGIESEGMILASGGEKVRVVFLSEETPLGERIR
ncbi:MAG: methionine--tRNA ligase [Ruminococcaceae bacterium]|nr:methionine--tRNA ligase [Oscillospiraceae bacterium]